MVDVAHKYYASLWSKGDMRAGDEVLTDNTVFRDNIWGTGGHDSIFGANHIKAYISEMRTQYPDLYYEIDQMGLQDTTHLFVLWSGHGTQLENSDGPASYHTSLYHGVDIIAFNEDRTKIVEVSQFRQPTAEERHKHDTRPACAPPEITLARLHWETSSSETQKPLLSPPEKAHRKLGSIKPGSTL